MYSNKNSLYLYPYNIKMLILYLEIHIFVYILWYIKGTRYHSLVYM